MFERKHRLGETGSDDRGKHKKASACPPSFPPPRRDPFSKEQTSEGSRNRHNFVGVLVGERMIQVLKSFQQQTTELNEEGSLSALRYTITDDDRREQFDVDWQKP